jgi:hypothetical protein
VYDRDGDLYGNIIGKSGDIITIESLGDNIVAELKFSIGSIERSGYRVEWVNVTPVGVYHGEF